MNKPANRRWMPLVAVLAVLVVGLLLITMSRNGETTTVWAQSGTADPVVTASTPLTGNATTTAFSIIRMLGALVVVLGCIYGAIWLLKRLSNRKVTGGKTDRVLEILETAYLDPKKSLSLVRVADRSVLIGVTDSQISILTELDPQATQIVKTQAAVPSTGGFTSFLQSAASKMGQRKDSGGMSTLA